MKGQFQEIHQAVGFAAGDIFHWLQQRNNSGDLNTLRSELRHIEEPILYQGMGWLMREGKLQVSTTNNGTTTMVLTRN